MKKETFQVKAPSMSLPKGGGAITDTAGISATSFTGSATWAIPLPYTPVRGEDKDWSLTYSSVGGNGPFGLGFSLDLAYIGVRLQEGVPRYNDTDTYSLNDGPCFVPVTGPDAVWQADRDGITWTVTAYLQEQESEFTQFEHWYDPLNGQVFWQSLDSANTRCVYGENTNARISNPDDPLQTARWYIESTVDPKGEKTLFAHRRENSDNIPPTLSSAGHGYATQLYPQSIRYGNYLDGDGKETFACLLVFDYGDYDWPAGGDVPARPWPTRPDCFSTFQYGFEIRTCRLCRNIGLFHSFPALGTQPVLTRVIALGYDAGPVCSLLTTATETGYRQNADKTWLSAAKPAWSFQYTPFDPDPRPVARLLEIEGGGAVPGKFEEEGFLPVDLYGEGVSGLLHHEAGGYAYWAPLGENRFDYGTTLPFPNAPADAWLTDLDGNGALEMVLHGPGLNGFYGRQPGVQGPWKPFTPFAGGPPPQLPPLNMEMVDLNGAGKTDLLLVNQQNLIYLPSKGTAGYGEPRLVDPVPGFPAESTGERVHTLFAGMFGDGLQHRVQIRSGQVKVWPSLGFGRFGNVLNMDGAPVFSDGEQPDILLGDVDGSGTSDILLVYSAYAELYINQSGNGFAGPIRVTLPEMYSSDDQVVLNDFSGNGTQALIFTKTSPAVRHYLIDWQKANVTDVCLKGIKPYLLYKSDNGMGRQTKVQYASSVEFYLEDKRRGTPWVTSLPFPVQVVRARTETDAVSETIYTQTFSYHEGYYDKPSREFQGFGYIESWDAQVVGAAENDLPQPPPCYTRTWYLLGWYEGMDILLARYRNSFFNGDPDAFKLSAYVLDAAINAGNADLQRQAVRALKGLQLRKEVYGQDQSPQSDIPYLVTQSCAAVGLFQAPAAGQRGIFTVYQKEELTFVYDREADDPRITHMAVLQTDEYTNPLHTCKLYYPRRSNAQRVIYPRQQNAWLTLTTQDYHNETSPNRWIGIPYRETTYEISGYTLAPGVFAPIDTLTAWVTAALTNIIPYSATAPSASLSARCYAAGKTYFWNDALTAPAPLDSPPGARLLLHHHAEAAFDTGLIPIAYGKHLDDITIVDAGGYALEDGYWWNQGLVQVYAAGAGQYYVPVEVVNSYAPSSSSLYQQAFALYDTFYTCMTGTKILAGTQGLAPLYLETSALIDYTLLEAWQMTGFNGEVSQVLYDPLGHVYVSAVYGKEEGAPVGDADVSGYVYRAGATFCDVLARPSYYLQGAGSFTFYDWATVRPPCRNPQSADDRQANAALSPLLQQPIRSVTLTGQQYGSSLPPAERSIMVSISYHDGSGEVIQEKSLTGIIGDQAWLSGPRTVFNYKGNPALEFLPYYTATPDFDTNSLFSIKGAIVSAADPLPPPTVFYYDALDRLIRTVTPQECFTKTVYGAWETRLYDEDDTIRDSDYYIQFMAHYPVNPTDAQKDEKDALDKASVCYNTPTSQILDPAGALILILRDNLGEVSPDALQGIVNGTTITPRQLFDQLLLKGYLVLGPFPEDGAWTADIVQVYDPAFSFHLDPLFQPFAGALLGFFQQHALTEYAAPDAQGRILQTTDPRLYYSNCRTGATYSNYVHVYPMTGKDPISVYSCDAGSTQTFPDIFGHPVRTWDGRGFTISKEYDQMQRPTGIYVSGGDGLTPLQQYTERTVYGDSLSNGAYYNLLGQVYTCYDQAGKVKYPSYSIQGKCMQSVRQYLINYTQAANWNDPPTVPLETETFTSAWTYGPTGVTLSETIPDGGVVQWGYNLLDQVNLVEGAAPQPAGAAPGVNAVVYANNITYDPSGKRLTQTFQGNTSTSFRYEPTTQRLSRLLSSRPVTQGSNGFETLQDISYTYDPVGNNTRIRDNTADNVFCSNQMVEALMCYGYDPLYRLLSATGRQHKGILSNTHQTGFMQSIFGLLCPPAPNDAQQLENYSEAYTYDASGNLWQLQHTAASASWTRTLQVPPDSNRALSTDLDGRPLRRMPARQRNAPDGPLGAGNPFGAGNTPGQPGDTAPLFDASGNLLALDNLQDITWSYLNQIVSIPLIQRPEGDPDADYYQYDYMGNRARKLTVSQSTTNGTRIHEKRYIGSYVLDRTYTQTVAPDHILTELQTERITDGQETLLNTLFWSVDSTRQGQRQWRYQMSNLLDSVNLEVNEQAEILSYEEYFPFGGTAIIAGNNQIEVSLKVFRYTGKECDDSSGLYYYGARYYISWLCRWMNPDPAGPADGLNLYVYVSNNPMTATDPSGMGKNTKTKKTKTKGVKKKKTKFKLGLENNQYKFSGRPAFDSGAKKIKVKRSATNSAKNEDRRHVVGYDDTLRPSVETVFNLYRSQNKEADLAKDIRAALTKRGIKRIPKSNDISKLGEFALTKLNSVKKNLPAGPASENQAIEHVRQQGMRVEEQLRSAFADDVPDVAKVKQIMTDGFKVSGTGTPITQFADGIRTFTIDRINQATDLTQLNTILSTTLTSTAFDMAQNATSSQTNAKAIQYMNNMAAVQRGDISDPQQAMDLTFDYLSL